MLRARTSLHFKLITRNSYIFFTQLPSHPESISNSVVSGSCDTKGSADAGTLHLSPVSEFGSISSWLIKIRIWVLGIFDIWKVALQVTSFTKTSLWGMWNMNTVFVVIDLTFDNLVHIPSCLWSWRNVCWGIFSVTWYLIFILNIVNLLFMGINISTSWINWWPLVASLSTSWWLSMIYLSFLLNSLDSRRWQITISCFTLIVISLRW